MLMQNNFSKCREWVPRGTSQHKWRWLTTLLLILTLGIGQMWGQETAVAYSFENNKVDESGYTQSTGDGNRAISSTVNRTGSYSLEQDNNNTSAKNCKIIVPIPSDKTKYVHVIAYLKKSSTATGNISLKSYCLYQGGGLGTVSPNSNLGTGWTRIATKGNKNNSSTYTTLELRINTQTATKGDKFYVDDVVMYTTTGDAKTDLKKPGSATITAHSTDALTWTSGTDLADDDCDATGVQKTLIFKKTSGTASGLNLNDQGVYSLTAKDGPSTVGDWTLVAVVDPSTESYTTGLTAGHHYAIVHRDLAYNYSNPVYTTITASCTEPTTAFANDSYTVDGTPLTLSSLISNSQGDGAISYEVTDANGTGASISEGVFTATDAGTATVTATQAADATNGYCQKVMEATITVLAAGAVEYNINYAETKGAANSNPAKYTKGTGIAEFAALADVTDFHFTGWGPASISSEATGDQTITAQWVAAYNVTFDAGVGSGTTPASFQKWEGAKFNLPGQGSMTAPSGKVFDGWKANGTKYAENAEYTMGNAAVEFVAQWKAVPQTIYYWQSSYSGNPTMNSAVNVTGGTIEWETDDNSKSWANESYNKGSNVVPADLQVASGKKAVKSGGNALYAELTLAGTEKFQEGDTIYVGGYKKWMFSTTKQRYDGTSPSDDPTKPMSGDIALVTTGSSNSSYDDGYAVIPAGVNVSTMYLIRGEGASSSIAAIKVIRPAQRDIAKTEITLSDLKVNNRSISSDSLATLVSTHSLTLKDEFAAAPEIKFNEHKVITYDDELLPATKVTDKAYTVTATTSGDNWQAQQEINSVTYTVTAPKVSSAKVYYYDGATKLGEEIVAINGSPVNAGNYDDKTLSTFVGWYNNSDLAEEHKIANIAALVVTKDTTVYGKWNPEYATSINIEQWTLTNGAGIGATTKTSALISAIGSHNFAHNLEWVNKNLELDSLNDDPGKTNRNYAYLGLKVKVGGKMVDFRLQNGQTVKVKFGATGNYPQVALNGGSYGAMSLTDNVWTYTADGADAYISIKTPNTNTVVIKQIMINEDLQTVTLPWRVTYDANGGTCATAEAIWSGAALILPDVTPADADHTFAGWYDEVSGGSLQGVAGASYNATDNITLHAQFAPVEYSVTYVGGEGATGSMGPEAKGWGLEYTALANTFVKDGHVFSGWAVTGVDGVSTIPALGSFTMPKNPVTLTAIWTDNSKVAQIVETNVKYESFAAAIAAVEADQTIQLLQDCEYSTYWNLTIADTVTLDLNGKNLTYTGTKRGVQVSNGGTLILMDGTATVAPTIDLTTSPMARTAISYTSGTFDSKDGMCALAGSEIVINSGTYLATEGVILVKGPAATATVNDGVLICRDNSVIGGNGTNNADFRNYVMNIHGGILYGEIFSAGYASMVVYHPNVGELNIDGGILVSTNGPCVVTRGGETNITGGTLVALGSGSGKCGDASLVLPAVGIAVDFKSAYPGVASTDVAVSGTVDVTGQAGAVEAVYAAATPTATEESKVNISGGTFNTELTTDLCAPGYIPSAEVAPGVYTVVPKDGVEIIGVVTTGGTNKTVTGLYKGDASVDLDNTKKLADGKYIFVTLKEGYTFEETDVLIIDLAAKSDLGGGTKALEITTGIGNIDGAVWKSIAFDDYDGSDTISLEGIAPGQTSIGLKRSVNQNAKVNGIKVLRPMKPMLTAITINDRDGVIDEANKTVAVTIPHDADLAALTVVPTIAWNEAAATNSIVVNNGGAWVESPSTNTYKLTDKDGDYTVYTITLTRDVLKHTVSFNTHGGSAVASQEIVHGEYLAAAPAAPTKDENVFKFWSETEDGAEVDVTTVQINADKEFHAVWEAEPEGIKLFTNLGLNTTNFISAAKATDSVEINTVKYPYLVAFGSNRTSLAEAKQADLVMYSATTDAAKIKFDLYNANGSAKTAYVWLVEEGDDAATQLDAIEIAGETRVKTAYYEFNGTKNRTVYLTSGAKADIKVLQAKVIESGSAIHQFGQAGYVVDFNKGRIAGAADGTVSFEGAAITLKSDYKVLNSTSLSPKTYIQFNNPVANTIVKIKRSGSNKYYVTNDLGNKGTEYSSDQEITLTATGTWYIGSVNPGSAAQITKIEFVAPKCAEPQFNALANSDICEGSSYEALDGTATVADAGVPTYQWYREDDSAIDGETYATYTPTADGKYYVIAVNHLAGYTDNEKKSALVTVTTHAGTVITEPLVDLRGAKNAELALTVEATGKNLHYAWKESATIDGTYTDVTGATDNKTLNVTVTEGMDKYYKVVVSSDCGSDLESVAHVTQFVPVSQQDVTASIVWDWSEAASGNTDEMKTNTTPVRDTEFIMANGDARIYNNANFWSDKLVISGQYAVRGGNYFQGGLVKFHTTVPGVIRVEFSHTGTATAEKPARELFINGVGTGTSAASTSHVRTAFVEVPAGDVSITAQYIDPTKPGNQYVRVYKVEFYTIAEQRTTGYAAGDLGTVCLEDATIIDGANLYKLAGLDQYGYLAFDEIQSGELEAGVPYLFEVTNPSMIGFYKQVNAAHSDDEIAHKGMIGTFSGTTLNQNVAENYYYFSGRHIWRVNDFTVGITIPAHRCYVDYDAVQAAGPAQAPAAGCRRVTLGVNGKNNATDVENLNASEAPVKLIIDGKMYILRGEKLFDATGRLVK